jgi:hypothetical protein
MLLWFCLPLVGRRARHQSKNKTSESGPHLSIIVLWSSRRKSARVSRLAALEFFIKNGLPGLLDLPHGIGHCLVSVAADQILLGARITPVCTGHGQGGFVVVVPPLGAAEEGAVSVPDRLEPERACSGLNIGEDGIVEDLNLPSVRATCSTTSSRRTQ